jgi:GT2 family glycosyltransferase
MASTDSQTAAAPAGARHAASVDLSVVIVNHNVKDFLYQCLRSLEQAARGISVQVIVVDNGSTDGSVAYLEPLFPAVEFIRLEENLGFGRANNLALAQARGDFILLLNPDTLLAERTLEVMLDYMRRHPEVGMGGCKILNPNGTFQLACRRSFPTPWSSFCKVFGLQRLFPRSPLFARYNQTFRNPDETHFVDAISGSFMFTRRAVLEEVGGFDPAFFMYGEDLDLCYRICRAGWKIAYVPQTSTIHFKGESTRRSSLDRVRVFYQAMEIYVRKHHGKSSLFVLLLRLGILVRSVLAYANRRRRALFLMLLDLASINAALLVATKLRFGSYFGFPDYAYPGVFLALGGVTLGAMLMAGEYFEATPSVRRAFAGLMATFFILSSLTYFFKDFGFSRTVLIMTVTAAVACSTALRVAQLAYDKSVGREGNRRIAIVGMNEAASSIIRQLQSAEARNADVVGVVAGAPTGEVTFSGLPVIGNVAYLSNLIEQFGINEVVITDPSLQRGEVMELIANASELAVKFHVAIDYEEIVAARIINDIAGIEPTVPQYNIRRVRYRLVKRAIDIAVATVLLTVGLPMVWVIYPAFGAALRALWGVLRGRTSLVGLYPLAGGMPPIGKIGLTGLAHMSRPGRLTRNVIEELNEYYIQRYTLALDFDILIKTLLRRRTE